jgi:hypothetical protein
LSLQNVFCKNVLCSANVLPLSACFLNMCFVLTCAFYLRIKSRWYDWKKTLHTVISQWKTQRVYSFSAVFTTYSCSRPEVARKRKCKNLQDSGREPVVSIWLYVVLICSERRLLACSNWLIRQIFIRKINIREEICYCITAYLNRVCQNSTYLNNNSRQIADFPVKWILDQKIGCLLST